MKTFLNILHHPSSEDLKKAEEELKDSYTNQDTVYLNFKTVMLDGHRYEVCVDGELYNMKELRKALRHHNYPVKEKGVEELVLYAYKVWKHGCLLHFNGSFSIMIDNGSEVFVAKDHMGTKPLYYARRKRKGLVVSNSIRLILKHGSIEPVVDLDGVREMFAFGPSISEDKTLYKGIFALPMGHYMMISNNNVHIRKYYEPISKPHFDAFDDTVAKVRNLVEDAVKRQSEGCDATFLSGGLDSSIIASICADEKDALYSYSLDYEGNAENFTGNMYQVSLDSPYIEAMAKHTGSIHTNLMITQQELVDRLEKAMLEREAPGMADVDSSLMWLCEQVAPKHRTILSGECSDEVFGGYPWFYKDELKDLDTFPWLRSTEERIALLNSDIKELNYDAYISKRYKGTLQSVEFLEEDSDEDRSARVHTMLCLHWFMQTLITRQVTMGASSDVTIRAPFADVRILDYVYNIPWEMKFFDQEEKGILRKAFDCSLPQEVAHRKKNPFPKTHNPLYTKLIQEKLERTLEDPNSILHRLFDDEKLNELVESGGTSFKLPWYGQLMSGPQLLAYLYQIDAWSKDFHIRWEL